MHAPYLESRSARINVGSSERIASTILGAALIGLSLQRSRIGGIFVALAGAGLAKRGISGRCPVYRRLGVTTAHHDGTDRSDCTSALFRSVRSNASTRRGLSGPD